MVIVFDAYSIGHIVFSILVGIFILLTSKRLRNGFIACLIIGIIWEILENYIIVNYWVWIGDTSWLNSIVDVLIFDMIGFGLAYLLIKKIERR